MRKTPANPSRALLDVVDYFGSQLKLAEELHCTQQFISKCINGKSDFPLMFALRVENMTKGKFKYKNLISEKDKIFLTKR